MDGGCSIEGRELLNRFYSPLVLGRPGRGPGGPSGALICPDTGGFEIEVAPTPQSQYVVGTATDRVWVYARHRRVKFNQDLTILDEEAASGRAKSSTLHTPTPSARSTLSPCPSVSTGHSLSLIPHSSTSNSLTVQSGIPTSACLRVPPREGTIRREKCIRRRYPTLSRRCAVNSLTTGSSSPVAERPNPNYYYVGAHNSRLQRHGWGRLVNENRILYEGGWHRGRAQGYYLAFHEYHTEVGFQSGWHRVGVYILGDDNCSIVPIAYERDPAKLRDFTVDQAIPHCTESTAHSDASAVYYLDDHLSTYRDAPSSPLITRTPVFLDTQRLRHLRGGRNATESTQRSVSHRRLFASDSRFTKTRVEDTEDDDDYSSTFSSRFFDSPQPSNSRSRLQSQPQSLLPPALNFSLRPMRNPQTVNLTNSPAGKGSVSRSRLVGHVNQRSRSVPFRDWRDERRARRGSGSFDMSRCVKEEGARSCFSSNAGPLERDIDEMLEFERSETSCRRSAEEGAETSSSSSSSDDEMKSDDLAYDRDNGGGKSNPLPRGDDYVPFCSRRETRDSSPQFDKLIYPPSRPTNKEPRIEEPKRTSASPSSSSSSSSSSSASARQLSPPRRLSSSSGSESKQSTLERGVGCALQIYGTFSTAKSEGSRASTLEKSKTSETYGTAKSERTSVSNKSSPTSPTNSTPSSSSSSTSSASRSMERSSRHLFRRSGTKLRLRKVRNESSTADCQAHRLPTISLRPTSTCSSSSTLSPWDLDDNKPNLTQGFLRKRRASYPTASSPTLYLLAEPTVVSTTPGHPISHREVPDLPGTVAIHQKLVAKTFQKATLHAANFTQWTNDQLLTFLIAIGAYDAAICFRENLISTAVVSALTHSRLRQIGINDEALSRFLLVVFRHLWNASDSHKPYAPSRREDIHLCKLNDEEVKLGRKIGSGGHAIVYQGMVDGNVMTALKIFTTSRQRRRWRVPPIHRYCADDRRNGNGGEERRAVSNRKWSENVASNSSSPSWTDFVTGRVLSSMRPWIFWSSTCNSGSKLLPPPEPSQRVNPTTQKTSNPPLSERHSHCRSRVTHKLRDHEARVMTSIPLHPSIVQAIGTFELLGGVPGLALEYCPAGAVESCIYLDRSPQVSRSRLHRREIINIFRDVAQGMALVHSAGFLHRDIKPSNILIGSNGSGKISDFGVAKSYVGMSPFFLSYYGNIYYAAPEVLRGEGFWPESDVYSFGVSFWEALTGQQVHDGLSRGQLFCRVATGNISLTTPTFLDPALKGLINTMISFDRRDRPTFATIVAAIRSLEDDKYADTLSSVRAFIGL